MSTYTRIKTSRRLVWAGIIVGYALALGVAVANYGSDDGTPLTALAFLAALSLPSSLALVSLDRRPSLLTMAAMAALVQSGLLLTSVGLLGLIPAILWYMASQRRPRRSIAPRQATWVRPLLAAATVLPLFVMFLYVDPLCVVTDPDGTVVRTYVEEGAASGWNLGLGSYTSDSSEGAAAGETTSCTSNRIVPWEASVSVSLSILYLMLVVKFWPTADRLPPVSDRPA